MTDAWDGRPERPERDGWHWLHHPEDLRPMVQPWNAELGGWVSGALHSPQGVVDLGFRYLGPALLPTEVAAREAAAAEVVEVAAKRLESTALRLAEMGDPRAAYGLREWAMNARKSLPAADALARLLEQARAEEREMCAEIARAAGAPAVVALIRRNTPAAIRARGKETNDE